MVSARRTRCRRLLLGEPPHKARVFPFSELVASMLAVCACLHMEVQNVTCARFNASGPTWGFLLLFGRSTTESAAFTTSRSGGAAFLVALTVLCLLLSGVSGCALWVVFCRFIYFCLCELNFHGGIMAILGFICSTLRDARTWRRWIASRSGLC